MASEIVDRTSVLTVAVDGAPWERVRTLAESGPDDPHYVLSIDESGRSSVVFGDGRRGRRPPAGSQVRVRFTRGSRFAEVVMQEGRVTVDADFVEPAPHANRFCGVYRAVVTDATDPLQRGRLNVIIPILGADPMWADPCRSGVPGAPVPSPGEGVWILFEAGDSARPVWIGRV